MKSALTIFSACIIIMMQIFSTGFSLSKKTCAHTNKVTYSLSNLECTCNTPKKVEKTCCSSKKKKEIKKDCCELETLSAFIDYKNVSTEFISFNTSIYEFVDHKFLFDREHSDFKDVAFTIYDPPPNSVFGNQLRIQFQSFVI